MQNVNKQSVNFIRTFTVPNRQCAKFQVNLRSDQCYQTNVKFFINLSEFISIELKQIILSNQIEFFMLWGHS